MSHMIEKKQFEHYSLSTEIASSTIDRKSLSMVTHPYQTQVM